MSLLSRSLVLAALVTTGVPAAASDVWFVGGPLSDFPTVDLAVDAAQPGDVILVRPGFYGSLLVDKGVSIAAFGEGTVFIGPVAATGISSSETLALSGLTCRSNNSTPALTVDRCAGEVRVQSCRILGNGSSAGRASRVVSSSNVTFSDSEAIGGGGPASYCASADGGDAVELVDADAYFYSSSLTGGDGVFVPSFPCPLSTEGGDGLQLEGTSTAYLSNLTVAGGNGDPSVDEGGGGNGVHVLGGIAIARGSVLLGGMGSRGYCSGPAFDGEPFVGPVEILEEPTRSFIPDKLVVSEGGRVRLQIESLPGDSARLIVGETDLPILEGTVQGYVLVDAALPTTTLGSVPASGTLTADWIAPTVPTGEGRRFALQAFVTSNKSIRRYLGTYIIQVLDDRFFLPPVTGKSRRAPASQAGAVPQ